MSRLLAVNEPADIRNGNTKKKTRSTAVRVQYVVLRLTAGIRSIPLLVLQRGAFDFRCFISCLLRDKDLRDHSNAFATTERILALRILLFLLLNNSRRIVSCNYERC